MLSDDNIGGTSEVTGGYVAPDAVLGGSGGGAGSAGPRDESIAFSPDELIQQVSLSLPFKLHALVAVGVAALCFVLWFFIGIGVKWFPWFIYPITFFVITLGFHFYIIIRPKEWLQWHIVAFSAINSAILFTWLDLSPDNLWFIYPLLITGWFLALHYLLEKKRDSDHFLVNLHGITSLLIILILVFVWLDTKNQMNPQYSWFVIPSIILLCLYLVHSQFASGASLLRVHMVVFGMCSLLFFSLWLIFSKQAFPWFIFPIAAWTALVIFHAWKARSSTPTAQPSAYGGPQA
eukprot:TRINITY_DN1392_c2_g1_i1.p1 TRINITY_DN1392_c2_g1~~TRINITY_DN1392_c2_g1_i1.p1  ORF type:complete len:299 (-),score=67.30 TRINITY_DN1392_c2_g1_i1:678-1550(-)